MTKKRKTKKRRPRKKSMASSILGSVPDYGQDTALRADLESARRTIENLEVEIQRFGSTGWNPQQQKLLRRLEHSHTRILNILANSDKRSDSEIISRIYSVMREYMN